MLRLLCLVWIALLVCAQASAQQKKAFIVGVEDYANLQDLTRTIEDANGYTSVFRNDLGFTVTPLTSNPARADFNRAFGKFLETIRPGDEVVFVFSGHGWSNGSENYLVFADARQDASEYELKEDTVALSTSVLQRIREREPSLIIAIIDACRDNPFSGNKDAFEKGLTRINAGKRTLVVYAAGEGQKARDRLNDADKAPYSLFTRVLLPKLRDPNRPLADSLDEARDEVERQAGTIGHEQRPMILSDVSNRFCFSGACVARGSGIDAELALWTKASVGTREARCAAAKDYLQRYESGQYRDAADVMAQTACGAAKASTDTGPYAVGKIFQDLFTDMSGAGPEMVVLPKGKFVMGSPSSEIGREEDEGPVRTVTFGYSFAVGRFEVTWAEWDLCVDDGGCDDAGPVGAGGDEGWGRGRRPVINVSWQDAQAYAVWLNKKTGLTGKPDRYRLITEAEWEYAARAGTKTPFSFGATIATEQANYDGNSVYGSGVKGRNLERTATVGSYPANGFGLHDMHGNVWEGVEDCYADSYQGAPVDGRAFALGTCDLRVSRGGSWGTYAYRLRASARGYSAPDSRDEHAGFRLARTLP